MKKFLFLLMIFFLQNCSKPKTVLICGDHICINKKEATHYFEENLSIEVKIVDKKINKQIDLVELNLKENTEKNRKITIKKKDMLNKEIKVLSNDEINKIKEKIKKNDKDKKIVNKTFKNDSLSKKEKIKKTSNKNNTNNNKVKINVNKSKTKVVDVCTILEKCSIDEISKYLLDKGKKKKFPDITKKEEKLL